MSLNILQLNIYRLNNKLISFITFFQCHHVDLTQNKDENEFFSKENIRR